MFFVNKLNKHKSINNGICVGDGIDWLFSFSFYRLYTYDKYKIRKIGEYFNCSNILSIVIMRHLFIIYNVKAFAYG